MRREREIHLFYGSRNLEELIFHEELKNISRRRANFHYYPVLEEADDAYEGLRGRISAELVAGLLAGQAVDTYYICGPQAMYDTLLPQLQALAIPRRKIRHEMFAATDDITTQPGWPAAVSQDKVFTVKVAGQGAFSARAGEPLLHSLEKAGLRVPSLCRSGECSLCRVQLMSGKVFQPPGVLLRESDRQYGYIHSCKAYPLEDLEIRL